MKKKIRNLSFVQIFNKHFWKKKFNFFLVGGLAPHKMLFCFFFGPHAFLYTWHRMWTSTDCLSNRDCLLDTLHSTVQRLLHRLTFRQMNYANMVFLYVLRPTIIGRAQISNAFGLNPPSQLVIGYHWLTFLNQVRKNFLFKNFEFIISHICKTKNRKYRKMVLSTRGVLLCFKI